MPVPRTRLYEGPALFSYGFRPFFLLAAAYTAVSLLIWLPFVQGMIAIPTAFPPIDWHIHEWLFGFLPAVITGFLFTAIPNWTGRMPLQGRPLMLLVAAWLAGRLAVGLSAMTGWQIAALIDISFLALVVLVTTREIIAGRNWRNLKVLLPVTLLLLANAAFHAESVITGAAGYSTRAGISAAIFLIILIGGRIIPSFTRNWLARRQAPVLPASFSAFDKLAILATIPALLAWIIAPSSPLAAPFLALAGGLQLARLLRWAGLRTFRDPLVLVLHISYAFIPAGLFLLAAAALYAQYIPQAAGIHALGIGAIGGMTLSVMVRASLGHTGRPLRASWFSVIIFASITIAAIARVLQALAIGDYMVMMQVAGFAWLLAFGGFALSFAPALLTPRQD